MVLEREYRTQRGKSSEKKGWTTLFKVDPKQFQWPHREGEQFRLLLNISPKNFKFSRLRFKIFQAENFP